MDPQIEVAVQAEQIETIAADVREIKADIKTVLPVVAVHAEKLGRLETRMDHVETQLNWGKWLSGIAAAVAALVAFVTSRGGHEVAA